MECIDPAGDPNVGVNAAGQPEAYNSGTNYSRGRGQLSMHGSLLFTAPHTGTFLCQVRAHTDAGNDLKYHLTAVAAPRPGGTWLAIDNFTGDAPLWWQINTCQSNGRDPTRAVPTPTVFSWAGPSARTAIRSPRPCTAGRPLLWTPRLCT